jgi:hypothetical protein
MKRKDPLDFGDFSHLINYEEVFKIDIDETPKKQKFMLPYQKRRKFNITRTEELKNGASPMDEYEAFTFNQQRTLLGVNYR